jgi:arginine-tRNA-protein transferase
VKREAASARLLFFATPPHPCGYLESETATTVFADPRVAKSTRVYSVLSRHGFRRSGEHLYRPQCAACAACVPVRVPVARYRARRGQQRVWRKNTDLVVSARSDAFDPAHFELYSRYMNARHRGGSMDKPTQSQYREFLSCSWAETVFYEFRLKQRLVAVAVSDRLDDSLSAVYTFFDPALPGRSLGIYAILWQIEEAKRLDREWLYLGYWIESSPKMRYKNAFRPQQRLINGHWVEV